MAEKLHWHFCRVCGVLGHIDDDQKAGRVSIRCPYDDCDGHYTLEADGSHTLEAEE